MNKLIDVIKGIFIGIANIIPGVSGGTLAVSMGVYSTIIEAVNNIRKDFKNSIKTLLPYGIGIIIGIAALSFIISFLFEKYEMPTISCFIGLVLGGVPLILNKVKDEKVKITHMISFVLMLAVIIVPTLIAIETPAIQVVEMNFLNILILIGLGIISAGAMVIPGVSGSMILMMLGYYNLIINTISGTIKALAKLDFGGLLNGALMLIPFAIGIVAGVVIISKIISKLMRRYPNATYWGILGLIVASPFSIIIKASSFILDPMMLLVCLITFGIGFFIANKLGEK
ncbi:MAG: DUF368 domain-containing protein [Clostridia bacterium]|nr:DUF368 domain-containing protein [Clostridia bacterium]